MWSKVVARHGGRPLSVRGIASSANALRFLIVDGYSPEGRLELTKSGVSIASDLYKRMLSTSADGLPTSFDVLFPSDGPFDTPDLRNYDAVAWTGCSLTVLDSADIRVTRQLELAKQCYAHGVPQYGSCWAAQIAVVAAGGVVSKNPRGREMGLARKFWGVQYHPEYDLREMARLTLARKERLVKYGIFQTHQDGDEYIVHCSIMVH
ncbi:hypothetical protein DYB26_003067 [Aphanomyces astaci]|uniref:Glutamine amidotransferase domain-containing protein n=1 Tax=Aphanomyces astaci TaxID=112090 RepID=A0A397CQA3_APHAT|nr:hypothetical protein DYB38_005326 [Aphanomyces astaci]RHZ17212.1 hypothetical protein DYB26_003067 [Aphanomyces astaci]